MNKEIQKQIQFAAGIISKWPAWKQNILKHSSQPYNSHPRPIIDNKVIINVRYTGMDSSTVEKADGGKTNNNTKKTKLALDRYVDVALRLYGVITRLEDMTKEQILGQDVGLPSVEDTGAGETHYKGKYYNEPIRDAELVAVFKTNYKATINTLRKMLRCAVGITLRYYPDYKFIEQILDECKKYKRAVKRK